MGFQISEQFLEDDRRQTVQRQEANEVKIEGNLIQFIGEFVWLQAQLGPSHIV